jgi:hypothetical protein
MTGPRVYVSVGSLLSDLVRLRQALGEDDPEERFPVATLRLASGQAVRGVPMQLRNEAGAGCLRIRPLEGDPLDVMFVDERAIVAVTVQDMVRVERLLASLDEHCPTTRLEFARMVGSWSSGIDGLAIGVTFVADSFPAGLSDFGVGVSILENLRQAFAELASDAMGRDALAAKITTIALAFGDCSTDLEGGVLTIRHPFSAGRSEPIAPGALSQSIGLLL